MPLPEADTSAGHSFGLEIDGVVIKQTQDVSGLKLEQDVIELKLNTADGKFVIKEDQSFEKWQEASRLGRRGTTARAAPSSSLTSRAPRSSA
jgi:hypothetical protein